MHHCIMKFLALTALTLMIGGLIPGTSSTASAEESVYPGEDPLLVGQNVRSNAQNFSWLRGCGYNYDYNGYLDKLKKNTQKLTGDISEEGQLGAMTAHPDVGPMPSRELWNGLKITWTGSSILPKNVKAIWKKSKMEKWNAVMREENSDRLTASLHHPCITPDTVRP